MNYDIYYNIDTTHDFNKNGSSISIKNKLDLLLNKFEKDNYGKCIILVDLPTTEDYKKILRISNIIDKSNNNFS